MLECLGDLDRSLSERGGGLVVRDGPPERELARLAADVRATEIHYTYDVSPFDQVRMARVQAGLAGTGVDLIEHGGLSVVDDVRDIRTGAGGPYTVFTPFFRSWQRQLRREPLDAPASISMPKGLERGDLPSLADLRLEQEVPEPLAGGEEAGRDRLERFLRDGVRDYAIDRDMLANDRTSRLSPYLRFGCVSPVEVESRLPPGEGAAAFRRQLGWRDFYLHVLAAFPRNAKCEFQERYRDAIEWRYEQREFEAWTDGLTGYPLVDAGMRQLRQEGFMHNRARLVAASFLTKHLGFDWRVGERWFMRLLLDGDESNNNGNWQWIASVGVDPQPPYRRIYNPARHRKRFDPSGAYVRRFVPELRAVPDEYLDEPSRMPPEVQEQAGCLLDRDYPSPIVDHLAARREALERFRRAAG
jgi:deoxyribodipyrimidine photo-lyase